MTAPDTELILNAIENLQSDMREIRECTDETRDRVGSLSTDVAVLKTQYKDHVKQEVKDSTKTYKLISVFSPLISAIVAGLSQIYR